MIGLWTGVPRSGKTYSLVYRIANKYCVKFGDTYQLKPEYVLITDIDGLIIDHYPLRDFLLSSDDSVPVIRSESEPAEQSPVCSKCGKSMVLKSGKYGSFYSCSGFPECKSTIAAKGKVPSSSSSSSSGSVSGSSGSGLDIKRLFSESGFEKLRQRFPDKKIIIIVDECQRYFHKRLFDRDIFFAFEIHGHYGLDIYLIAHHITKISKDIADCLEFETRLVPRRFGFPGFFFYLEKQGFEVVGRGRIPVKQQYFDLYKSEHFKQGDNVQRPFILYFGIIFLCLIFAFWSLYSRFSAWISPEKPVVKKEEVRKEVRQDVKSDSVSQSQIQSKDKDKDKDKDKPEYHVKEGSALASAKRGYRYYPVPVVVVSEKNKKNIMVAYETDLIPLELYPYKTVTMYRNGNPYVYELAPIRRKKEDQQNQNQNRNPMRQQTPSFIFGGSKDSQSEEDFDL